MSLSFSILFRDYIHWLFGIICNDTTYTSNETFFSFECLWAPYNTAISFLILKQVLFSVMCIASLCNKLTVINIHLCWPYRLSLSKVVSHLFDGIAFSDRIMLKLIYFTIFVSTFLQITIHLDSNNSSV